MVETKESRFGSFAFILFLIFILLFFGDGIWN